MSVYIPKHFEERDIAVLHALIESNPLGVWVTQAADSLLVNHIPFLVDATRGEYGTLVSHVARANPVWQSFSRQQASVVIFQGPHAYITPSWYSSKHEHGKVVPTWNYAIVHAHGIPRVIDERCWLLAHVTEMVNRHESPRTEPWRVTDAPSSYIDAMVDAIVGIEIPIATLVGKWKTSQNRSDEDKRGIVDGLHEHGEGLARQMAALVQQHVDRSKGE